jgi:hypothetical protein
MSAIKLSTPSSGSISLSPADTASNLTITVPAVSGTMNLVGPAFSAGLTSAQTVSNSTFTKIQCNSEEFDTANCYDNSTNYRFTPNVAGYYQVSGSVNITSTNNSEVLCVIYKNGSQAKWGAYTTRASIANDASSVVSALIYLNGTTDYVELYGYVTGTGTLQFLSPATRTYFQATMVRGA